MTFYKKKNQEVFLKLTFITKILYSQENSAKSNKDKKKTGKNEKQI